MGDNTVQIRLLSGQEYCLASKEIFNLHLKNLPSDVMPRFGNGYHMKYMLQLLERKGHIIVALSRGSTIGFLTVGLVSSARTIIPGPAEILCFARSCIRQPTLVPRLLRQLSERPPKVPNSTEIEFFAVDEEFRGQGVGRELLHQAQRTARQSGSSTIVTKTNNLDLVKYYERNHNAEVRNLLQINGVKYYFVQWTLGQS